VWAIASTYDSLVSVVGLEANMDKVCARRICASLLAAATSLTFSTAGLTHGDWPEGAHKEWFQNLQRPDNAQPPELQLDPKSLFCCGAADVVKTKFKVEPAGGRCPDDVWYGWLNDTWTKVPPEKIVKDFASNDQAHLFVLAGTIFSQPSSTLSPHALNLAPHQRLQDNDRREHLHDDARRLFFRCQ
jgi:hypothetical protein